MLGKFKVNLLLIYPELAIFCTPLLRKIITVSSTRSSKSTKKTILWLVLITLALSLGYWLWHSSQAADSVSSGSQMRRGFTLDAIPVSVAQVRQDVFVEQIKALGTVQPWQKAEVSSQVSGILEQVYYREGQYVEQGELLAQIDARSYQAALLQAEGALQETQAQLKSAQLDLKRYRELRAEDAIAQQTLEHQQATVNQLQGTLKVRQAQWEAAKLDVEYSRIRAPISGRVGLRAIDVGNHVAAGSTVLATLTQQQPIAVSFTIAEQSVLNVQQAFAQNEALTVQVWNRAETELIEEGQLDSMDNQVDAATGTLRLKARLDNADNLLFAQQFVNVVLQVAQHKDVLLVPNDALQFGNQGRFVWRVLADKTVERVSVQVVQSDAQFSVVSADLSADETIVIEGVDRLKDGSKVEIIRADGSSEPVAKQTDKPHAQQR